MLEYLAWRGADVMRERDVCGCECATQHVADDTDDTVVVRLIAK